MYLEDENLEGKIVLEIGCGLGRTTNNLVMLLSKHTNTKLIVTDVMKQYLTRIQTSLENFSYQPQFIETNACDLIGVEDNSVDYIVCNFAICEINSIIGQGTIALDKFYSVLKPGGKLFIEEEMPITEATTPSQKSWSNIWRVLKSALILIQHKTPSNEYMPDILCKICNVIGFSDTHFITSVRKHDLDWMEARINFLKQLKTGFPSPNAKEMFLHLADDVANQTKNIGYVDVPIYHLTATKPLGN